MESSELQCKNLEYLLTCSEISKKEQSWHEAWSYVPVTDVSGYEKVIWTLEQSCSILELSWSGVKQNHVKYTLRASLGTLFSYYFSKEK